MGISAQHFGELLNIFVEKLSENCSYAGETKRGISNDLGSLKKYIAEGYSKVAEYDTGNFADMVKDFINDAAAQSTKARRLYSCQMVSYFLFENNVFEKDILSEIRIQDITSTNNNENRFFHKDDVLSDGAINSMLGQAWDNFTGNFDPVNYLLLSFLLSGVRMNTLSEMKWDQVIQEGSNVTLLIEENKIPLSYRIAKKNFMDCMEFYKKTEVDKIFPLSKAGLVRRIRTIGNSVNKEYLSSMNFRWTCIHDLLTVGFDNDFIATTFGVTKGYLKRIIWE